MIFLSASSGRERKGSLLMSRIAVMRSYLGSALFSASDLVNFTGCRHCTFLDLRDLLNGEEFRGASEPQAELLRQKGLEHERAFLSSLMDPGFCIAEIATHLTLEER